MADTSPKATYLARLLALFQDDPAPKHVRALLDRAQAAGVKPKGAIPLGSAAEPWTDH
jgi:hypothetical protein